MIVAFWSRNRRIGTTSCILATAAEIALKMKGSCLMTQMYSRQDDLESMVTGGMSDEERECVMREMGSDALIRQFKAGRLGGEDVFNCSVEVMKNLSFLAAPRKPFLIPGGENARNNIIERILSAASERFETVLIDVGAGREKEDKSILSGSDIVVAVCEQGRKSLQKTFEAAEKSGIQKEKLFIVFPRYLPESKYNINNLKHVCENIGNESLGAIPSSYLYMDALEDKRAVAFLQCFEKDAESAGDPGFYAETVRCGKKLIEKARKNARKRSLAGANGEKTL